MKSFQILVFLLPIFFFISCDDLAYSPSKENNVDVKQPSVNDIKITFSNTEDTLALWGETVFRYSLDLGNKTFSNIDIYLNNNKTLSTTNPSSATINTTRYDDGFYTLRFEVYAYTNSNSLADKLGLEMVAVYTDIPVIIDNAPPEAIDIEEIKPDNGQLLITWPKYTRSNFQSYKIIGSETKTITSADENYYYDPIFIGNETEYKIIVNAANKSAEGNPVTFSDSLHLVSAGVDENDRLKLQWEECKYYNNFKRYDIREDQGLDSWETIASVTDVKTTKFTGDIMPFGNDKSFFVAVVKKNSSYESYQKTEIQKVYRGKKLPIGFNKIFYDQTNDNYILQVYYEVHLFDSELKNKITSTNFSDYESIDIDYSNGQLFASKQYKILKLDPSSFTIINQISTSSFWGMASNQLNLVPYKIFYTNNNKILFEGYIHYGVTTASYQTYLADLEQPVLLDSIHSGRTYNSVYVDGRTLQDTTNVMNVVDVSENGNFTVLQHLPPFHDECSVYDISSNSFRETYLIGHNRVCFRYDNSSFVEVTGNIITIRNNSDGSVIKSITSCNIDLFDPQIDPVTGYLGAIDRSASEFVIYNLDSGEHIKSIKIVYYWPDDLFLLNSTLFSVAGYYLPLE